MKIVINEIHRLHEPRKFMIRGRPSRPVECPERVGLLMEGIDAMHEIVPARSFAGRHVTAVHDEAYVAFLEHGHQAWIALPGSGPEIIPNTHPNRHSFRVPDHPVAKAGYYIADTSTAIGEGTFAASIGSAEAALTAACLLLEGQAAAYALCRPPGHHACSDLAWGFCYLNNAAIAAQYLREGGADRVAIIDIDAHHGNGTQQIFYTRDDVLTVSVHVDTSSYPGFYTGYADELGEGHGKGFNRNIALAAGTGDDEFLAAVRLACSIAKDHDPQFVIVALGFDLHADDPLSITKVSSNAYLMAAREISGLGRPVLAVQEGGYPGKHLGVALRSFLEAF